MIKPVVLKVASNWLQAQEWKKKWSCCVNSKSRVVVSPFWLDATFCAWHLLGIVCLLSNSWQSADKSNTGFNLSSSSRSMINHHLHLRGLTWSCKTDVFRYLYIHLSFIIGDALLYFYCHLNLFCYCAIAMLLEVRPAMTYSICMSCMCMDFLFFFHVEIGPEHNGCKLLLLTPNYSRSAPSEAWCIWWCSVPTWQSVCLGCQEPLPSSLQLWGSSVLVELCCRRTAK